jgi:hypothetical protein
MIKCWLYFSLTILFLTDQTVKSEQYTSAEEITTDKGNNSGEEECTTGKSMIC